MVLVEVEVQIQLDGDFLLLRSLCGWLLLMLPASAADDDDDNIVDTAPSLPIFYPSTVFNFVYTRRVTNVPEKLIRLPH